MTIIISKSQEALYLVIVFGIGQFFITSIFFLSILIPCQRPHVWDKLETT